MQRFKRHRAHGRRRRRDPDGRTIAAGRQVHRGRIHPCHCPDRRRHSNGGRPLPRQPEVLFPGQCVCRWLVPRRGLHSPAAGGHRAAWCSGGLSAGPSPSGVGAWCAAADRPHHFRWSPRPLGFGRRPRPVHLSACAALAVVNPLDHSQVCRSALQATSPPPSSSRSAFCCTRARRPLR